MKVKLSNNLWEAVLQAMLAVCRGIKIKYMVFHNRKIFLIYV